jgi:hypothetical protein
MGQRAKRAVVVAALVMTVVAGGVLGVSGLSSPRTADAASPAIDLRIRIAASESKKAPVRLWRLRCKPAGGDWPSVGPACRRLKPELLASIVYETNDYTRVTRQPVSINGRAFGKVVSLRFPALGSGTRASRLRALRTVLGPRGFSQAERRSR